MIKTIADFIISFFDLVEAEGRTFRRAIMKLCGSLLLLVLAGFLLMAAAGFFLTGMYSFLTSIMCPWIAALLVSFCAALLAGILGIIVYRRNR
ncbi:MAG: hypothetical protein WC539_00830 [Nitrospirota bacterium]